MERNTKYLINGYKVDDKTFRQKLISFGFLPGVIFEVVRSTPLGGPLEIDILGSKVAIRQKDMAMLDFQKV